MPADFDNMLKNVLSDPDAMQKIGSIAQSLGMSAPKAPETRENDSSMDVEALLKAKEMFDKISNEDDPRMTLLSALKPYLNRKRTEKLDSAMKILKISKLAPLIKDFNLL